jgi:hypothetical protein
MKKAGVLRNHGDGATQGILSNLSNILAIDQDEAAKGSFDLRCCPTRKGKERHSVLIDILI